MKLLGSSGCWTKRKIADVNGRFGLIAQLEERRLCEAEAGGSNPPESTGQEASLPAFDAPGDVNHRGRAEGLLT